MFYLFLIFLLIRPFLDLFEDFELLGLNVASIYTIFLIIISLVNICLNYNIFHRKRCFNSSIFLAFLIFFICLIPSILISNYMMSTFTSILKYLTLIIFSIMFCFYSKEPDKRIKMIKTILVSYVISAIYGIIQFATGNAMYDLQVGGYRIHSFFVHPNSYAFYLIAIIAILLFIDKKQIFKNYTILYYSLLLSGFAMLALTYCRSAWIWVLFILIGYFISSNLNKKLVLFLVFIVAFLLLFNFIQERFVDVVDTSYEGRSSMDAREIIWKNMLGLVKNPNLFGYGLGTFVDYNLQYFNSDLPAHNEYVHYYFESGILGVSGLILFFLILLCSTFKIKGKEKFKYVFLIIGLIVCSYSSNIFSMLVSQIYFVAIFTIVRPTYVGRGLEYNSEYVVSKYEI